MTAPTKHLDNPVSTTPISGALRAAIAARGVTANRLGRAAGIDPRNVRRWLVGQSDLTLASVDRLAVALGLRLAEGPARKAPRRDPSSRAAVPLALPDVATELLAEAAAGDDQVVSLPMPFAPIDPSGAA
jgi:hypothetical protein